LSLRILGRKVKVRESLSPSYTDMEHVVAGEWDKTYSLKSYYDPIRFKPIEYIVGMNAIDVQKYIYLKQRVNQ